MKSIDRRLIPLAILATLLLVAGFLFSNSPEANRRPADKGIRLNVDTQMLVRSNFPVQIESYGTVQPRTQSLLVAQVSGQITDIRQQFREGRFFSKGDVLIQIDPRDARANVKIAEASLMDARQALQEEKARAAQAAADWKRLGRDETPNDLVLRKPQMLAAQARLVSAEANLDKARLALERTRITAPFDGRVLNKFVDLGQVVSTGTQLGEIYATDAVEIRLPIRNRDLAYLELPESYSDGGESSTSLPGVSLHSSLIEAQSWQGKIVRTEGAIDQTARQLHVIAEIDNPFSNTDASQEQAGGAAIKIGQYVTAQIEGRTISGALAIPETAVYQNSFVYIVVDGVLQRREIGIAWQNGGSVIISDGLEEGQELVLTPLGQVSSGTRVKVNPAAT